MNLYDIPMHLHAPDKLYAVIEIPKGSSAKYEYCPEIEQFKLDRCLNSAMVYTSNYGFIPGTKADDGDPLDILVYNNTPIDRGTIVECNVVGVLDMTDQGKKDYKILAAPVSHVKRYRCVFRDIDPMFLKVTRNFFKHYKDLERKKVRVGEWMDNDVAKHIISNDII